jgi:prepilin-type N-terminal cleavage/methylation domain-containing protein
MACHAHRSRRCPGFTLVELLVASAIATAVIAGALTLYIQVRQHYSDIAREVHLLERALYVLSTLQPDLELAGFLGLGERPPSLEIPPVAAAALRCAAVPLQPLTVPLGFDAWNYPLQCPVPSGGALAGTGVLTLRRVASRIARPEAGRLQLLTSVAPALQPQLIADGLLPAGVTLAPQHTELRDLIVRSYYIAQHADGDPQTPALRVKSLTRVAGVPAFVDTEVMPGVEDLQITPHPDATNPRWVELTLHLRPDAADLRANETPPRLRFSRRIALRNAQ